MYTAVGVHRQEVEELKLNSSTTLTELKAAKVQDELLHSQLRVSKRAVECEKDENQALRQQVQILLVPLQSNVCCNAVDCRLLLATTHRMQCTC